MSITFTKLGACRGDGKFYLLLRIPTDRSFDYFEIHAYLENGIAVPASLYPLCSDDKRARQISADDRYVAELPLIDDRFIYYEIEACDEAGNVALSQKKKVNLSLLKWESRFNYRFHKKLCAQLRDYEKEFTLDQLQIFDLKSYEGNNENTEILRFYIEWGGEEQLLPEISMQDCFGKKVDTEAFLLEKQELISSDGGYLAHRIYFSVEIASNSSSYILSVSDDQDKYRKGFQCINNLMLSHLREQRKAYMRDAQTSDAAYRKWFSNQRAPQKTLDSQKSKVFDVMPLVSVVVLGKDDGGDEIRKTVQSIEMQSYQKWELCYFDSARGLEEVKGDYLVLIPPGDILEPDALYCCIDTLEKNPNIDALSCDEDSFEQDGFYSKPILKPHLNLDLLHSYNYLGSFLMLKTSLVKSLYLSEPSSTFENYDLILRVIADEARVYHVAQVLYHRKKRHECDDRQFLLDDLGKESLETYFQKKGVNAVVHSEGCQKYRIQYPLKEPLPFVDIIIPNKDNIILLDDCVRSILEKASYPNFQITIIENNSMSKETFSYYEKIQAEFSRVKVIVWEEEFNYSKLINYGAQNTSAPYLLFLNNDTKVITGDFIEDMLGYLQRPEVGVVGAKLYFRDGLVQHAGMLVGPNGAVSHVNQNFTKTRPGYLQRAICPGNFSAVTGACQMVKRSVFELVGGYTEELAVGFNDVDFCLKVRAENYLVVLSPYSELFHYEFSTRGRELVDKDKLLRWEKERDYMHARWPKYFKDGDPQSNPNLEMHNGYYALPNEYYI